MVKPRLRRNDVDFAFFRCRIRQVLLASVFLIAIVYVAALVMFYVQQPIRNDFSKENDIIHIQGKEAALSYVKSIKSFDRSLKFFHIPKTAGTAVESAAGKRKIPWGSCLFYHKPKRGICPYPKGGTWPEHLGWWHVPAQFFPINNINPYADAELFAITRDPYDRMVSEFYYICTLKVLQWRPDQCDRNRLFEKEYMNEWLKAKIKDQQSQEPSASLYLMDNGHFTPQHDFIYGPHEIRMIDYVLSMDESTLSGNFTQLMKAFFLDKVQLEKKNALGAQERGSDAHLGVEHLDDTTARLIHEIYANDFSPLGYSQQE